MKDLCLVLIGGLCAAFGGFVSTWYRAKKAQHIKMEETIGERKVDAYKKALRLANQLQSILVQGTHDDVLSFINDENLWVVDNEILLPIKFAEYWHSVRLHVQSARRREKAQARMSDGPDRAKKIDTLVELGSFTRELAKEAENEIRKDLGLPSFKIHHPKKTQ